MEWFGWKWNKVWREIDRKRLKEKGKGTSEVVRFGKEDVAYIFTHTQKTFVLCMYRMRRMGKKRVNPLINQNALVLVLALKWT